MENEERPQKMKVSIATGTVLKVFAIILVFWLLYLVRDVLAIVFMAVVFAAALEPTVDGLHKRKIPRWLSLLVIYLIVLGLIVLIFFKLIPPLTNQLQNLIINFPVLWEKMSNYFAFWESASQSQEMALGLQSGLESIGQTLATSGGSILSTLGTIFGGIVSLILVLVITFYLVIEENAVKKSFRFVSPAKYQPYLTQLFSKMQRKLGLWLKGQLLLCLIVALMVYIFLMIVSIWFPIVREYALILALIAFLGEAVPYVGPIISAVPAVFLGLADSIFLAVIILFFYWLIQWTENNLLVPQVMRKTLGLNPIIIIIALLVGAKIGGVVGVILAIPVTTALSVVSEDLFEHVEEKLD